jgi:hypothetical protein
VSGFFPGVVTLSCAHPALPANANAAQLTASLSLRIAFPPKTICPQVVRSLPGPSLRTVKNAQYLHIVLSNAIDGKIRQAGKV